MRSILQLSLIVAACAATACASGGASKTGVGAGGTAAKASDAATIANAIDVAGSAFVGSRRTKKFYPSSCHTVKLIKTADQVGFASQRDAEAAGYAKDAYSTDCQY